ncbi:MAG: GNAT family N-acetyltransferase [Rhodospirillales bacterium]|nr:GNAT family N-acetyltransferase [Rhodospirillales bacterium]MDE2574861.1 GNAT family N-acetyltransferase [Rhodospirillales bacterium]
MYLGSIVPAVETIREEVSIEIADSPEQLLEAYRLRNQVYCKERGYFADEAGVEIDTYDVRSHHALLRTTGTGEVLGTVRLVLPTPERPQHSFPMQHVCTNLLPHVPLETTAEISRFAISKQRRTTLSVPMMRLALMQGILRLSGELGLTHWCAMMEPPLLRLLQATAIHFHPIGPLLDHHGLRQPCYNDIDSVMTRIGDEQPVIWDFLTDGGRYWPLSLPMGVTAAAAA